MFTAHTFLLACLQSHWVLLRLSFQFLESVQVLARQPLPGAISYHTWQSWPRAPSLHRKREDPSPTPGLSHDIPECSPGLNPLMQLNRRNQFLKSGGGWEGRGPEARPGEPELMRQAPSPSTQTLRPLPFAVTAFYKHRDAGPCGTAAHERENSFLSKRC